MKSKKCDNFWSKYTKSDSKSDCVTETVDTEHETEHNLTLPPINIKKKNSDHSNEYINSHRTNNSRNTSPTRFPPIHEEKNQSTSQKEEYDPFIVAEKQLMELLQCDDFKPYKSTYIKTPSPKTKSKYITETKPSITNSTIKQTKRASVIEPPDDFQDKLNLLHDNFEVIENFFNDNFVNADKSTTSNNNCKIENNISLNTILSKRKYNDEINSIDPKLINETDNLKIPDKLSVHNYSPDDIDHYSVQYDKNISILEPLVLPKTEVHLMKRSISQYNENLDDAAFEEFVSSFDDDQSFPTLKSFLNTSKFDNKSKKRNIQKSANSLNSSFGLNAANKKHPLSPLKRSVSLSNPVVKARSMKSKQDIQDYLHVRDNKPKSHDRDKAKTISPQSSDELFPVGHEMYNEYKKYEEQYRKEQVAATTATAAALAAAAAVIGDDEQQQPLAEDEHGENSSNEDCSPSQGDKNYQTGKINTDSAYGSLNRKSPKVQQSVSSGSQKQTKSQQGSKKTNKSSSNSDTSASAPVIKNNRLTKFCHECGTKYPLESAKFCVECGIKRLIL